MPKSISATKAHVALFKTIFDFDTIKVLLDHDGFTMVYDAMFVVNGPYAKAIFVDELGQAESTCMNTTPKDDFGGLCADPNLTYAKEFVETMGFDCKGMKIGVGDCKVSSFGAAVNGYGDCNMILRSKLFATPSDSLAIIAAYANGILFFCPQGGLKGVTRSMPTNGAVDLVADDHNFNLLETPTGWK
eukprot:14065914-Ditylum_brightwellii.AAC.1